MLLGAIIEKTSGEDYYEYMRTHIYAPAAMTRTDHYAAEKIGDGFAIGYLGRGLATGGVSGDDGRRPNEQRLGRGSPGESRSAGCRALRRDHRTHAAARVGFGVAEEHSGQDRGRLADPRAKNVLDVATG